MSEPTPRGLLSKAEEDADGCRCRTSAIGPEPIESAACRCHERADAATVQAFGGEPVAVAEEMPGSARTLLEDLATLGGDRPVLARSPIPVAAAPARDPDSRELVAVLRGGILLALLAVGLVLLVSGLIPALF